MAFCTKCGADIPEGVAFCTACGTPAPAAAYPGAEAAPPPQAPYVPPVFQTDEAPPQQPQAYGYGQQPMPDYGAPPQPGEPMDDAQDAEQNKLMGILAYLSILALVPWFAAPNSPFARFHAKEGIKLLLAEVALSVVRVILGFILHGSLWSLISMVLNLLNLGFLVLSILGIVNAAKGEKKGLPILGNIDLPFLNK